MLKLRAVYVSDSGDCRTKKTITIIFFEYIYIGACVFLYGNFRKEAFIDGTVFNGTRYVVEWKLGSVGHRGYPYFYNIYSSILIKFIAGYPSGFRLFLFLFNTGIWKIFPTWSLLTSILGHPQSST